MIKPGVYIICLCLCITLASRAQYYNLAFRNYSSTNGLTQSEVNCTFMDHEGFMWIGTWFGLNRYDGKYFVHYNHETSNPGSIADNTINAIDQDSKGNLWIAIYNAGMSMLPHNSAQFKNFRPLGNKKGIVSQFASTLIVDCKDNVWLGTEEGLSIYDQNHNSFANYSVCPAHNDVLSVKALFEDFSGKIWIGTDKCGLLYKNPSSNKLESFSNKELPPTIFDITQDSSSRIWLSTSAGIYYFKNQDPSKDVALQKADFFPENIAVKSIRFDQKGNIWIATRVDGLYIYDVTSKSLDHYTEDFNSARGLLSNRLSSLYRDPDGGMWVGSENGVQSFYNAAQKFYIYPDLNTSSDKVRGTILYGIYEKNNELIIASSAGILVYNRSVGQFIPVTDKFGLHVRYRIIQRIDENIWWVYSDKGIFELVKKEGQYIVRRPEILKPWRSLDQYNIMYAARESPYDYWLGTYGKGLIHLDLRQMKMTTYQHHAFKESGLPSDIINVLYLDREGNLEVGTHAGISILPKGDSIFYNISNGPTNAKSKLNNKLVYDIYDAGKYLWFATYGGGLNRFNKKDSSITYFTSQHGLSSNAIYSIVAENDSVLWLGTNSGLSRFNSNTYQFTNYTLNDGLQANEFNLYSSFKNEKGEIFMGTINGIISFLPNKMPFNRFAPRLYISKVKVNNVQYNDSGTNTLNDEKYLEIKYHDDLTLEFSPLSYSGSDYPIRYKIPQLSDQWLDNGSNSQIQLINFEPGYYDLYVQEGNSDKVWSNPNWKLRIYIVPPFWKTSWFKVVVGLLILVIIVMAVRAYTRSRLLKQKSLLEKQRMLELERARISTELHDDIGGGLTAIRLMSEMIKEKSDDYNTRNYLEKISQGSNDLIQKMNEIVWALNVNHDNLQSLITYTRQYAVSYLDDVNIQCNVEVPEQIPEITVAGSNRRSIFLMVKEALNNIVKHAHASGVDIRFAVTDVLEIAVHDNGKGINVENVRTGANGLLNMRKRVEALKGSFNVINQTGTTIVFDIPVSSLAHKI